MYLLQEANGGKNLSQAQLECLNLYKEAAKDCLKDHVLGFFPIDTVKLDAPSWKPGMKGVVIRAANLDLELLEDVEQTPEGVIVPARAAAVDVAVCTITIMVQNLLQGDHYRDHSAGLRLAERDAHTFQHLSENAIKTFYP
jgi:hypothetical protein